MRHKHPNSAISKFCTLSAIRSFSRCDDTDGVGGVSLENPLVVLTDTDKAPGSNGEVVDLLLNLLMAAARRMGNKNFAHCPCGTLLLLRPFTRRGFRAMPRPFEKFVLNILRMFGLVSFFKFYLFFE